MNTTISNGTPPPKSVWRYILLATTLFVVSLIAGLYTSTELAGATFDELKQSLAPLMETMGALGIVALLFFIFLNNAIKALGAIAFGIVLGIPSIIFIAANGFMIGIAVVALQSSTGFGVLVASLVPHGIIEIPLLLLASALGLSVGKESLNFLLRQKSSVRVQLHHGIRIYLTWILAGLFLAALIEVFITPLFILLVGGKELLIN